MKLKPFAEMLAMTKQAIDEALAPVRARHVKAKSQVEIAKLDEKLIKLEREITELCTQQDISFDRVLDKMDEYELTERRINQFNQLVADLFPATVQETQA